MILVVTTRALILPLFTSVFIGTDLGYQRGFGLALSVKSVEPQFVTPPNIVSPLVSCIDIQCDGDWIILVEHLLSDLKLVVITRPLKLSLD